MPHREAGSEADRNEGGPASGRSGYIPLGISAGFYLLFLFLMVAFGDSWRAYHLIHGAWYASFIALSYTAIRSGIFQRLTDSKGRWAFLFLFIAALALHIIFFVRDPALSQDILRLEERGRRLLDGQFPYRDFQPNKPPLYIWMVGTVSAIFGPYQLAFRAVFSVLNALIPVVMLSIGRMVGSPPDARLGGRSVLPGVGFTAGALLYALCPIPILEAGLAGHFDPAVVLVTLLSFRALLKGNSLLSGILLGAGMSLKIYPLFIAPIFLLSIKGLAGRGRFLLGACLVPILSSLPVVIVDPGAILGYFEYQTVGWYSGTGLRSMIEYVLSKAGLPVSFGFLIMTSLLLVGGLYIYSRGITGAIRRRDLDFVFALSSVFSIYLIHFTFVVILSRTYTAPGWLLAAVLISIPIAQFFAGLFIYTRWPASRGGKWSWDIRKLIGARIPMDMVPILSSSILILLLLASAQFHPWYLLWIIPFLAGCPPFWTWSMLLLFALYQSNVYLPLDVGGF